MSAVDANTRNDNTSVGHAAGHSTVCKGCGQAITDQYILRVSPNMEWHAACLKCSHCNQFLDEKCTCFVREEKTYCKRDYLRLFGRKCSKCGTGTFSATELVMRARDQIFHVECFRCSACDKQLLPGDEFALRDGDLFCRHDLEAIKAEAQDEELIDDNHNTHLSSCPVQLAEEPELASRDPPSRPSTGGSGITNGSDSDRIVTGGRREGRLHKNEGKPTRIRTVLTEKQLHTLGTCYNANPRPDALMKEQLVEMTGLSPRVIRVWFQNKRCKDKKRAIYLKQSVMQQEKGGRFGAYGSMQGVPLVASPPSHQDPPGVAFDVTPYQPPWKSLTEFALSHDIDRIDPHNPQYQQVLHQMHGYGMDPEAQLQPQFTNLDDVMPPFHSHGPPSNPSAHFPGTPSELSSTSSE